MIVQPQKSKVQLNPVDFTITPDTLQNVREVQQNISLASHLWRSPHVCDLCPAENIITKVPDQRSPGRQHLCDHATSDRRAGGGEFRGHHQKH